jgi:hypothetical protein
MRSARWWKPSGKRGADVRRVAGVERRYGFAWRGRLWRGVNPMSATGMKQGREVDEGASRQEGERPWRRNVSGEANPGRVDLVIYVLEGRETSREEPLRCSGKRPTAGGQALKET